MQITAVCPHCSSTFQLDQTLRGRKIRCPNAACRQVFEIPTDNPKPVQQSPLVPPPVRVPPPTRTGHVQDLIPVVQAEVAAPIPSPPPGRKSPEPPPRRTTLPEVLPAGEDPIHADWRRAPPTRGETALPTPPPPPTWEEEPATPPKTTRLPEPDEDGAEEDVPEDERKKRRARRLLVTIGVLVPLLLLLAGGVAWFVLRETEAKVVAQAERDYSSGQFHLAAAAYRRLYDQFPESLRREDYRFLSELSDVRSGEGSPDTVKALDHLNEFLDTQKSDPRLTSFRSDLAASAVVLLREAIKRVRETPDDPEAQDLFARARATRQRFDSLDAKLLAADVRQELDRAEAEAKRRLDEARLRQALIASLRDLATRPSVDSVRQLHEILRQEEARGPESLAKTPEVLEAVRAVYAAHRASVRFAREETVLGVSGAEDTEPSVIVQPLLRGQKAAHLVEEKVVFALVKGVLYAVSQSDGAVVWAMRVGIDTAHLPLRLPPQGGRPEIALVLSADTLTLTAVDARKGDTLWRYRLGSPSLGRPLLIDRRAYLATYEGQVHEIELAEGNLIGRYLLGQPISQGGGRAEGSRFLYFAADEGCVYVLDTLQRQCAGILYTDHTNGSLRGEPIVVTAEDPRTPSAPGTEPPGFLVLGMTQGLDETVLKTYDLPLGEPRAAPLKMDEPRLRGWSWFPPYRDAEKVLMVTDAGVLGLYGVRQPLNQDSALFPLVRVPGKTAGMVDLAEGTSGRGRAEVVAARENDLWVLARGTLQRYLITLDRTAGPRVVPHPSWKAGLALGSPLHEGQMDEMGTTLFVVTQPFGQPHCLMTAVDTENGEVRWQRQLGLSAQGDPLVLGGEVITLDQGGAVFTFDPKRHVHDEESAWQTGGLGLAPPLAKSAMGPVHLLRAVDGKSVYEVACLDPGSQVLVRQFVPGQRQPVAELTVDVARPLAGTPVVGAHALLLTLADGGSLRIPLPLGANASTLAGPDWRVSRLNAEARCHAAWLGNHDFVMVNGGSGLTRYRFRDSGWVSVPEGREARVPTRDLGERIVTDPVVLPREEEDPLRIVVAGVSGTLYLLEGEDLRPVRRWELRGTVTAGPFVRGNRIGVVLNRRRLAWVDPSRDGILWSYESPGEGILGQPHVVEGMVLLADLSGRFQGIDVLTGKPRGPGYTLRASVAPAATPCAFGPGRAFAPLTDGTVLLLSLRHLGHPLMEMPFLP